MIRNRQSKFPVLQQGVVSALSEEPITIDGMKLVFDQKVALFPADIEVKEGNGRTNGRSSNRR
jgi:hypothetical protein